MVTPDTVRLRSIISSHREEILEIVAANRGSNPRVFGSVLHGDAGPDSDIDFLVDATEDTTLFDLAAIRGELGQLLGAKVDVCTPASLPPARSEKIIAEAEDV